MDGTRHPLSRRGLLAAVGAGSTIALMGSAGASAGEPAVSVPGRLVVRDRIASATTHLADGRAVALAYSAGFHERLEEWQRFWWANSPAGWVAPFEIHTTGAGQTGQELWLTGIRYTQRDRLMAGFDAGLTDAAYWSALASLHAHFATVRPDLAAARVRVGDGHPGFTGTAEQVSFVRAACAHVWGDASAASVLTASDAQATAARVLRRAGQDTDITTRAGWRAFTRATVRLGLGTESF